LGSDDEGQNWSHLLSFKDDRADGTDSSTGYLKLALDSRDRIRVVAAAEGDEGYRGNFITTNGGDVWDSHEMLRTPIRDVVLLSDAEVLACGRRLYTGGEKTENNLQPSGIILHSADGGASWSTMYRSGADETFISLTNIGNDQIYAVSDAGTFIHLTLPGG
jgi:photosystem II stability/assembly factor-like uncharacterized protein